MFVDVVLDQPIGRPLTYQATPKTLPYLQEGSLVEVAIGNQRQFGVVTKLRRHAPTALKTIRPIRRLYVSAWADRISLQVAQQLANYTNEPLGICLFRLLPPPLKRPAPPSKLGSSTGTTLADGKRYHLYSYRTQRFAHYIRMMRKACDAGQQTLVLVPNASVPGLTEQLTQAKLRFSVASGELSAGKQRALAQDFKTGAIEVLIGTRHLIGWQAHCLRWLIVDDPTHPAHTDEQRPYADTATIAWLRHRIDGSHLILGTALPTLGMALAEQRGVARRITMAPIPAPIIANSPAQQLLVPDIERLITDHQPADEPIALIAPRAGVGGLLICQQCQWTLRCPSCAGQVNVNEFGTSSCYDCVKPVTIPTTCPTCSSPLLKLIGIGDQSVRAKLEQLLGTVPAHVQIGTETLLESQQRFQVIVFVYADSPLLSPQLDRPLAYARGIWEACGLSDRVIIQTREPTHPFWLFLAANPAKAFDQTLHRRRTASLPPFSRHLRVESANIAIDLSRFLGARLAKRTSIDGHDSMDLLLPTATYQPIVKALALALPKARLKVDSILHYA